MSDDSVKQVHEEKETLSVDINIPGHDPRVSTPLFIHSRKQLIEREGGRCWLSGMTAEDSGHPLEAHHHPIERSLANMVDWPLFAEHAKSGFWGEHIKGFDWDKFFEGSVDGQPVDPYLFVDDMTVNGVLLAKQFHTGKDEGIHDLPLPLWIAQKYGKEGYKFSGVEIIHHSEPK